MKIYLVGGAVRDKLLGLPVQEQDQDWVVVGATPSDINEMIKRGFRSVGKDFPVFLHPETNEEYALARIERKVGRGYTGFDFNTSPQVSLEDDLKRRDLTINAMALPQDDLNGKEIDYYGGRKDLENRILRHVSPAFAEDPVRILRIARFAARSTQWRSIDSTILMKKPYPPFEIAPETMTLMKQMVDNGEVDALVPERVWKELERALGEPNPEEFFKVLVDCGALAKLFPELLPKEERLPKLSRQLQSGQKFLGEYNLIKTVSATQDTTIRFAALVSDLPEQSIKAICERYRLPTEYRELALKRLENRNENSIETLFTSSASSIPSSSNFNETEPSNETSSAQENVEQIADNILKLLMDLDAFRREERFLKIVQKAEILKIPNISILFDCFLEAKKVMAEEFLRQGITGKELGEKINEKRKKLIAEVVRNHREDNENSAASG